MMKTLRLIRLVTLTLFLGSAAKAQLITFDDVFVPAGVDITAGYNGFTWNNLLPINGHNGAPGSGYEHGAVSDPSVAFNGFGQPASFSSATKFNLHSLYLTAAWQDGLTVEINGLLSGNTIFHSSFVLSTANPTFISLDWLNIDTVAFNSFGGTVTFPNSGTHFALDNVLVSRGVTAVPEPASYGFAGIAFLASIAALRRMNKNRARC